MTMVRRFAPFRVVVDAHGYAVLRPITEDGGVMVFEDVDRAVQAFEDYTSLRDPAICRVEEVWVRSDV